MTDEEYVRSVWERVLVCDGSYRHYAKGTILLNWANHCFYEFTYWTAAAEFTRERLERIRQVHEEIATTRVDLGFAKTEHTRRVYSSILVREKAALAELKRGMK